MQIMHSFDDTHRSPECP